jgi:hypothetical protein
MASLGRYAAVSLSPEQANYRMEEKNREEMICEE